MLVLGIETTCDETACAVVRNGTDILSSTILSQASLHNEHGGVVPELSCRKHLEALLPLVDQAVREAQIKLHEIDLIAVAHTPGLIGALSIGLQCAKGLSIALQKPLIGINHVEAHLYAAIMSQPAPPLLPCLGLVVSGGHTNLWLVHSLGRYQAIGQSADDAIGEAFDKVARMLLGPYPGGPFIEKMAMQGDAQRFALRAGRVKGKPYGFSFSGLKTAVLYALQRLEKPLTEQDRCDMAASFQYAAFSDIIDKTRKAAEEHGTFHLLLGGGVTASRELRRRFASEAPALQCHWPDTELSLDNAAMIAGLACPLYKERGGSSMELQCLSRSSLSSNS